MRYASRYSPVGFITGLVNFFLALIVALLGIRIILRLFAANPTASFVNWVYTTTDTIMAPFRGIFPVPTIRPGGYVLDLPAIFAVIVYALIGYLILALVGLVPAPWDSDEVVEEERPARRTRVVRR